jgi:hypothetical protein
VVPVPITTASAHRHALLRMNPEISPERGRHRDGPAVDGAPRVFRPDPWAGSGDLGDHREASAGRRIVRKPNVRFAASFASATACN